MRKSKLLKMVIVGSMAVLTLTACGNDELKKDESGTVKTQDTNTEEKKEIADVKVSDVSKKITDKFSDISFAEMTESYVNGVMSIDVSKVSEYSVYVDASGTSVDEFGIFKANDDSKDDVQKMVQDYLDMRLETWMDEYMPEEKPKVESAEVKNKGNYYFYAILGDSEKKEAFSIFDSATTK